MLHIALPRAAMWLVTCNYYVFGIKTLTLKSLITLPNFRSVALAFISCEHGRRCIWPLSVEEGRGVRTTVSTSECQHSRLNCPSVGIDFVSPRASSAVRVPAHGLRLRRRLRPHSAISHLDDHRHGAALFSPARQRAALLAVQKTFLMFWRKN